VREKLLGDLAVRARIAAADVVDFAERAVFEHLPDAPRVVVDVKPIANLQSRQSYRANR
jgi:hypothetical protein